MKKRHKKSSFTMPVILVLLLILFAGYIYITKNPAIIDKIPNVKGKQLEPTASPTVNTPVITAITPESTIKAGAFNLQAFGTTKANRPEVMEVLSKIIRNYDVIAVEEIRDSSKPPCLSLKIQ